MSENTPTEITTPVVGDPTTSPREQDVRSQRMQQMLLNEDLSSGGMGGLLAIILMIFLGPDSDFAKQLMDQSEDLSLIHI